MTVWPKGLSRFDTLKGALLGCDLLGAIAAYWGTLGPMTEGDLSSGGSSKGSPFQVLG